MVAFLEWLRTPSPLQVVVPVALYSIAGGIVWSNNLYVFKSIACALHCRPLASPYTPLAIQISNLLSHYRHPVPGPSPYDVLCSLPAVQVKTSALVSAWSFIEAVCSIISVRILTRSISKRGRRFGFLICGVSGLLFAIGISLSDLFGEIGALIVIFIALLLSTVGNQSIIEMSAGNYVVDLVEQDKRNAALALIWGTFLGAIGIGTALGGYATLINDSAPYWFAAAYFLFGPNVIGGSILSAVPESMSDSRRNAVLAEAIADDAGGDTASLSNAEALSINLAKSRLHRLLDRVNFLKQLGIFLPGRHRTSTGRKNWRLTATGVALFIIYIGGSFGTPLVLLTMINRLHYDQRQSGVTLTVILASKAIFCFFILPPLTAWGHQWYAKRAISEEQEPLLYHGMQTVKGSSKPRAAITVQSQATKFDLHLLVASCIIDTMSYAAYGFVNKTSDLIVAIILATFASGLTPSVKAYAIALVPFSETDHLLGAIGILQNFAALVAPVTLGAIYTASLDKFPAAAFICVAACFAIGGLLPFMATQLVRR